MGSDTWKYRWEDPVPANLYVDGKKVNAPNLGIQIGKPIFPDIDSTVGIRLGNFAKRENTAPARPMTWREKLRELLPHAPIAELMNDYCPQHIFGGNAPQANDFSCEGQDSCTHCWNTEYKEAP